MEKQIKNFYEWFYDWFSKNVTENKNEVRHRKLIYLYGAYADLESEIKLELPNTHELKDIRRLNDFLEKTIKEYESMSDTKNRDYEYFDRLTSWYSIKIDLIKKILKRLSEYEEYQGDKNEYKR